MGEFISLDTPQHRHETRSAMSCRKKTDEKKSSAFEPIFCTDAVGKQNKADTGVLMNNLRA